MKTAVISGVLAFMLVGLATPSLSRDLKEIQDSGEIIIGMRKNREAPPIQYTENGERKGIDIDISRRIAAGLKVYAKYEFLEKSDDRIPSLLNNKVDIVVDSFSVTDERRKQIDFSTMPYVVTGVGLLLSRQYAGTTWSDIGADKPVKHLTVAVEGFKSSMNAPFSKYYEKEVELKVYDTDKEAFSAFLKGETDGFTQDYLVLEQRANQGYLLEGTLTYDSYGVGVSKAYPDVRDAVSNILMQLDHNGDLQRIIEQHTHRKQTVVVTRNSNIQPSSQKVYTIHEGDNLSLIAKDQCGNLSRWRVIWEENKKEIPYPDLITPGATLRIPANCSGQSPSIAQQKPPKKSVATKTKPVKIIGKNAVEKRLLELENALKKLKAGKHR